MTLTVKNETWSNSTSRASSRNEDFPTQLQGLSTPFTPTNEDLERGVFITGWPDYGQSNT